MSFISVGMQSLWEGMKTLPAVGKMLRVMELLFKITAKLTGIERTLIDLQKNCTGSLLAAIVAALLAVAAAITAVAAAIADPEPSTKIGLVISAISAIVAALVAIKHVIDVSEANKAIEKMEEEMHDLKEKKKELGDLLDELKKEVGK